MRNGMRNSADQPSLRTSARASQFSSQSIEKSVSLARTASSSVPPALTSKTKALLPSRRVPSETLTQSASTSRSRRVRRAVDRRGPLRAVDAHVERVVVVDHAHRGGVGGARALARRLLREGRATGRLLPGRVVEPPVEDRRGLDVDGVQVRDGQGQGAESPCASSLHSDFFQRIGSAHAGRLVAGAGDVLGVAAAVEVRALGGRARGRGWTVRRGSSGRATRRASCPRSSSAP